MLYEIEANASPRPDPEVAGPVYPDSLDHSFSTRRPYSKELSFRRALAYVIGFLLLIRGRRSGDWVGDCNGQHCFTRTHRASARHRGRASRSRAKGRVVYGRTSPAGPRSPRPR